MLLTGEDVSANKDGGVLKSRIKEGSGNPPKDGAICDSKICCAALPYKSLYHSDNCLNSTPGGVNWKIFSYILNKKANQLVGQRETRRHSSRSDCRL